MILHKKKRLIILFALLSLYFVAYTVFAEGIGVSKTVPTDNETRTDELSEVMVKAKIVSIMDEREFPDPISQKLMVSQTLKVRVTSGAFKGQEIVIVHNENDNPAFNIRVKPGDGILLVLMLDQGKVKEAYIADLLRVNYQYLLAIIFVVLLLAIGWKKGAKALCSLLLTLILIGGVLLPGLLKGYSPVFLSTVVAFVATALTMLIVGGWSTKSFASILGTLSGVAIAGVLALVAGKAAHLTGFGVEEAAMLLYLPDNITLDIQGILFAGIIIGALGASMDVSMSIASSIEEVKRTDPSLQVEQLIRSGMNVGRDIMGTMANTLILAYTGSSIQLMLVFMAFRESPLKIFNLDMVASEVVRAFSGSIGMISVIPLTALIAGMLFGKNPPGNSQGEGETSPDKVDFWQEWEKDTKTAERD